MGKNQTSNSPERKIARILKNTCEGKTITELTEISQLSHSSVSSALARLEGEKTITFHPVGMAKVYFINEK